MLWLVDFNGISILLGLFYTQKIGRYIHCTFMFTFFVDLFLKNTNDF